MNKNHSFQRDCTDFCKSVIHGNIINAAITKRSISDLELCSYLNYMCTNCESVKDSLGRTALHIAASCGKVDLVRWLLKINNTIINLKDEESGYTPLHRALFYGKINVATELIKEGANCTTFDLDNLTPLEHVTKDGQMPEETFGTLYTWGLNNNNSLGSFSSRSTPECLHIFHKKYPKCWVQQVCVDKFHSLIVTTTGDVFSCGHGLGGRLGLGTEQAVVVPTKIEFQSNDKVFITHASIARDHCLFLNSDCLIYSCGSNQHKVLGISPPPEKSVAPQKIKHLLGKSIVGISSARYHSVAWTSKILYTWGLNAGQIGHEPLNGNNFMITPRQVKVINPGESVIKTVASSDGAIAIATSKGDVYILHEYQCRKIASRLLDIADVAIIGGKLNITLDKELKLEPCKELKVVVRTNVGNLLLWQESDQQLCRCIFSIPRAIIAKQVAINLHEILFITNFGEAYRCVIKPRKKKSTLEKKNVFNNFLIKEECITLKLEKIPKIHRAISIVSDSRGEDYCIIQQNPFNRNLFQDDFPESEMKKQLADLLNEASEEDNIHDICIKIGNRIFPAHKYILANRSRILQGITQDKDEIIFEDVNVDVFEQMLLFIYTGDCDLLKVGKCPEHFKKFCTGYSESDNEKHIEDIKTEKRKKTIQNPVRMLQQVSKRFGCSDLYKILNEYDMQDFLICRKGSWLTNVKAYQKSSFPEYYDIVLRCTDNREIKAHKCILAARMEYFNNMFSIRWSCVEKNYINIPYPSNLVDALLEFLYTDSANFLSKKDCDFLLKLLVVADEYLVNELKNHCACLLLTLTYLDLKNAVEILQFAHYYKAISLKQGVMRYIVNNMAYFLETQAFNDLSDDILNDLTQCYFEERPNICCRVITPYSTAVCDEEILKISNMFPVNSEVPEKKKVEKIASKLPKRRSKTPRDGILEARVKECFDGEAENADTIIQFPDNAETYQSTSYVNNVQHTQKRVAAISTAMDKIQFEDDVLDFTNLNESFTLTNSNDFPLLNSPPDNVINKISPSSFGKSLNKHKMFKLSQKERKRLSSESKDLVPVLPESPKNPWKIIPPESGSPISSPSSDPSFCSILSSEKKQKENLAKMTNKLLIHTQMEDKAILDLEKFYNIDNIEDEIISVQRVEIGSIAAPTWIPRNQVHSGYS